MFPLKDIEEAKTYLHEKHTAINSGKTLFYYAICLKGNNIPIGYIHVSGGDSYDLGYGLRKRILAQMYMFGSLPSSH